MEKGRKKGKKGSKLTSALLCLALFAGLSLLLYPTVSNYWNSFHSSQAIAAYAEAVNGMDADKYAEIWEAAVAYNENLASGVARDDTATLEYNQLLNVGGTGVMGYIEIPSIEVSLPVYHGTSEGVLQIAAGHLDWTSLPVGGESSHCVLSGHRGLPSAKLFTNLDKLIEGDTFMLRILDEVLTYEVDQILIVEPQDTAALQIEQGKDYCTLVTCTPYGINTHRMLVRGHRIETEAAASMARVTSDAIQVEPKIVAPILAVPMLLLLLFGLALEDAFKKK